MKQPSKEALAVLAEVHRELDAHEAKIDAEIQGQLDKQRKAALKLITEARKIITKKKKYIHAPTSKLHMLDEIERYCMKWGYMPDSYKRMCRRWKSGQEMYLNEWEKMLGWVSKQDRSTTDGAELKTFKQEHGQAL
jgi:hypothetical protein